MKHPAQLLRPPVLAKPSLALRCSIGVVSGAISLSLLGGMLSLFDAHASDAAALAAEPRLLAKACNQDVPDDRRDIPNIDIRKPKRTPGRGLSCGLESR